mgnify:CR=1 FL=1
MAVDFQIVLNSIAMIKGMWWNRSRVCAIPDLRMQKADVFCIRSDRFPFI